MLESQRSRSSAERNRDGAATLQRSRTLDAGHPYIALDWNNIGRVLADQGDLEGGAEAVEKAIAIASEALGPDNASTAQYRSSLGAIYTAQGRFDEAAALLDEAVDQLRAALPEGHWRVDEARSLLGANHIAAGRLDEGRAMLEESIVQLAEKLGPDAGPTKRARAALVRGPSSGEA